MTTQQYQKIYDINASNDIDEIEKAAYTVCQLYGYATEKVNGFSPFKFLRKVNRSAKLLNRATRPQWYRRGLPTDAKAITLGQFIEVVHWMKGGVIESLHLIAATQKHGKDHARDADKYLHANARRVLPYVLAFIESFNGLMQQYAGLFEADTVKDADAKPETPHPFIERYGWIFSAKEVAAFEGCTLEQAYDLPIIQALNDLSYLKTKQQYEKKMQG